MPEEVTKNNITYGIALEKGVLYCMCKQPTSKKVIMTSLLFPFTIIGIFTLIIGTSLNSYYLVLLSIKLLGITFFITSSMLSNFTNCVFVF